MSENLKNFKRDLAEVSWRELRIHLQRDAVIVVSPELDLIEAAEAVADDDKDRVESWITSGLLAKPAKQQLESWEVDLDRSFSVLIIQPFLLEQQVLHS